MGAGAGWVLQTQPARLGAGDDPAAFIPLHRVAAAAHHKHAGLRLAATGLAMESLVPTVLKQRVPPAAPATPDGASCASAANGPRKPAPAGMLVPPAPSPWCRTPSWQ
ncbi:hypothetical protein [Streptomyces flaveolus]|uniref:hypothetical protein n=1 Tax=Streptomyces flaveolus TaxID=67297 RepID=UPI0033E50391